MAQAAAHLCLSKIESDHLFGLCYTRLHKDGMLDEVRLEEQEKLKQMADEAKRRKQEEVITAGMEAITVAMETNSSIDS